MWDYKERAESVSTRYQLLKHYKLRHGHFGCEIGRIMATMDKHRKTRPECILKALIVYLNEEPPSLVKEYLDIDLGAKKKMEDTVIGIYVIKKEGAELLIPQRTLAS
ncbi:hypothetical protein J4Q44_G00237680 [Coregonus suidteri]|uniref:Uncharacterized protein n=1 Tax=Coregonus suidteri TaxID=861788 RepID=A0AAN8L8S7_9TELE